MRRSRLHDVCAVTAILGMHQFVCLGLSVLLPDCASKPDSKMRNRSRISFSAAYPFSTQNLPFQAL